MISPFEPKRTGNVLVDQNLNDLKVALAQIADAIPPSPTFYSNAFTPTSATGNAYYALPPIKDSNGRIVQRAAKGSRVVALWIFGGAGPALNTDQADFEMILSKNDQIKQISAFNITAFKILVTLVNA